MGEMWTSTHNFCIELNENFYEFSLLYQYLVCLIKPLDHHVSKMYFQFRTRLNYNSLDYFWGRGVDEFKNRDVRIRI